MNKIINKFLKLDLENKSSIIRYFSGSSIEAGKFCSLLTSNNYYSIDSGIENCFYRTSMDEFMELHGDNILLTFKHDSFINGMYVDPKGDFCLTFSRTVYNEKQNDDFEFFTTKLGEKELFKFIKTNFRNVPLREDLNIYLLQESRGNYDLKKYPVFPIIELDIPHNYNDDFVNVDKKLYDILINSRKSFSILHGLPGTGKTTYIKNLCYRLAKEKKEVVYLPPSITHMLSSPSFISNLDLFKNKILIIEDAESILLDAGNRSQAIANILNITDGILSDIYNIHFIFTFNMDIRKIDQALLRKGRLSLKYEFKELTKEKVDKLSKKLNITAPLSGTLAELYNTESNGTEVKLTNKLGF